MQLIGSPSSHGENEVGLKASVSEK